MNKLLSYEDNSPYRSYKDFFANQTIAAAIYSAPDGGPKIASSAQRRWLHHALGHHAG